MTGRIWNLNPKTRKYLEKNYNCILHVLNSIILSMFIFLFS